MSTDYPQKYGKFQPLNPIYLEIKVIEYVDLTHI